MKHKKILCLKDFKVLTNWRIYMFLVFILMLGILLNYLFFSTIEHGFLDDLVSRLLWTGFGIALMFIISMVNFNMVEKYLKQIIVVTTLFLFFSANIWIFLRSTSFSFVAELGVILQSVTLLFPLLFSVVAYLMKGKGYRGFIIYNLVYCSLCFISFIMPGLVTTLHLIPIGALLGLFVLLNGGFVSNKIIGCISVLIPNVILLFLLIFMNANVDSYTVGFIPVQVRELITSSALVGGASSSNYLTNMQQIFYNDFFLTAVVFHFGWLIFILVLFALLFFIIATVAFCIKRASDFGSYIIFAIFLTFITQIIYFVLANLGLGVRLIGLPFLSMPIGNSALLVNLMLFGIMISFVQKD